ncbi:hypothetical protein [Acidihalobacter yilgarnensis]|uniref:hypothetical protein n=1 Tax=Acidihalobacter yilgarnensis TaxID=2819280 RepID=UPI0018D3F465|nr:hypothetical protein [Acidihalobacter yilgarnensis]
MIGDPAAEVRAAVAARMLTDEDWTVHLAAAPRVRRQRLRRLLDDPVAEVRESKNR